MKMIILLVLTFLALPTLSQAQTKFTCLADWHQQELKTAALSLSNMYPNLRGVGFGKCLDLPHSSVLSVASGHVQNLPQECTGLTFDGFDNPDVVAIAKWTLGVQTAWIDGKNGAAIVQINGLLMNVPICMQSWKNVVPQ